MINEKTKFRMYGSYEAQVELLSDEQAGKVFKAILAHRNGKMNKSLEGAELMTFAFIKAQMDMDLAAQERVNQRNRINGSKGGRPRKKEGTRKESAEAAQSKPLPTELVADASMLTKQLEMRDKCTVTVAIS